MIKRRIHKGAGWARLSAAGLLLCVAAGVGYAQTQVQPQKNQGERRQGPRMVVPGDKPSARPSPTPSTRKEGEEASQPGAAARSGVTSLAAPARVEKGVLPFRVEVSDMTPDATVVLAVGAVTLFRCPEPPLQVVIGNSQGIGVAEAVETQGRGDFYLRPSEGGLQTNMFIEMPSGTVQVMLRTVEPKSGMLVRPGDYNGEVFIRPPGFKDELQQLRQRVKALEAEVGAAGQAKTQAVNEARNAVLKESQVKIEDAERRASAQGLEGLEVLTNMATQVPPARASRPMLLGNLRVTVPASPVKTSNGRVWLVLQVGTRDKTKSANIDDVSLLGAQGRVLTLESVKRTIPAGAEQRLGVVIDITRVESDPNGVRLGVMSGGELLEIPLQGVLLTPDQEKKAGSAIAHNLSARY